MLLHLAGMILLSLHTAESREGRKIQPKQEEVLVSPGTEVTMNCSLSSLVAGPNIVVSWYKEDLNQNLREIYKSSLYTKPSRKYSSPLKTPPYGSLTISNVQRNDSGVYYCATLNPFEIHQRIRLIVKNPSKPTFSILAPSILAADPLHHDIPLLCFIFDANPAWKTVSWDIDGETFQVPKLVDTIDEDGVFSIWSLKLVPPKTWTQSASDSCSVQHNRTGGAEVSTRTGNCPLLSRYYRIPCIFLLLFIPLLILFYRKRLTKGNMKQEENI